MVEAPRWPHCVGVGHLLGTGQAADPQVIAETSQPSSSRSPHEPSAPLCPHRPPAGRQGGATEQQGQQSSVLGAPRGCHPPTGLGNTGRSAGRTGLSKEGHCPALQPCWGPRRPGWPAEGYVAQTQRDRVQGGGGSPGCGRGHWVTCGGAPGGGLRASQCGGGGSGGLPPAHMSVPDTTEQALMPGQRG